MWVLTYDGIVRSCVFPGREGRGADVVLGFADLDGCLAHLEPYLGVPAGRYANRIAGGRFTLDGQTFAWARNNGPNSLHGSERRFDQRMWDAEPVENAVRLSRVSPEGEEGLSERLEVSATYLLRADRALEIVYQATTDAATVVKGPGRPHRHRLRFSRVRTAAAMAVMRFGLQRRRRRVARHAGAAPAERCDLS